jgi:hypothetical protein
VLLVVLVPLLVLVVELLLEGAAAVIDTTVVPVDGAADDVDVATAGGVAAPRYSIHI